MHRRRSCGKHAKHSHAYSKRKEVLLILVRSKCAFADRKSIDSFPTFVNHRGRKKMARRQPKCRAVKNTVALRRALRRGRIVKCNTRPRRHLTDEERYQAQQERNLRAAQRLEEDEWVVFDP